MPKIYHCAACDEFFSSEEKYQEHYEDVHQDVLRS